MSASSSVPSDIDPGLPPPSRGGTAVPTGKVEFRSHWDYAWSRFKRDRFAFYGGLLALVLVLMSAAAPLIAPADPLFQYSEGLSGDFAQPLPPGSGQFRLGTDSLGRDFLSRLIWGRPHKPDGGCGGQRYFNYSRSHFRWYCRFHWRKGGYTYHENC